MIRSKKTRSATERSNPYESKDVASYSPNNNSTPHDKPMNKTLLKKRISYARQLNSALISISKDLDKIPSFTGKARFIDKVIKAEKLAGAQKANLEGDLHAMEDKLP